MPLKGGRPGLFFASALLSAVMWGRFFSYQREQMPLQLLDLRVPPAHLYREPFHSLRQLLLVAAASARSLLFRKYCCVIFSKIKHSSTKLGAL